jgi:methionyl-tRNA formyltransferase
VGLRVAFLGNDRWSVPPLEDLAASSHEVAVVVTRAPKPAGRGNRPRPTAVADAARRLALPLAEVATVKSGSGFERLEAAAPDVLVVVAYGEILPRAVLELATPVNLHFSLLPELRGPAPVQRAVLEGMTSTGVSTMVMDEGVDTGPVLLQAEEPVDPEDDAGTLGQRLAEIGGRLLVDTLDRLEAGAVEPTDQDEARATRAPRIEDRSIDWTADADLVARFVRALSPEPSATTTLQGRGLKVLAARAEEGSGPPGAVLEADKRGILVAAGTGAVRLLEVAPEGRKRMTGSDLVRGYRPRPGERLG